MLEFENKQIARNLMSVHGLRAQALVQERIAEARLAGDHNGLERWQNVRAAIAELRAAYARMTAAWGESPFAAWFQGDINNAQLASIATYYDCVPGFERELEAAGGDLKHFYRRVSVLAKLDAAARDAAVCGAP